jgi:hypothetical protein
MPHISFLLFFPCDTWWVSSGYDKKQAKIKNLLIFTSGKALSGEHYQKWAHAWLLPHAGLSSSNAIDTRPYYLVTLAGDAIRGSFSKMEAKLGLPSWTGRNDDDYNETMMMMMMMMMITVCRSFVHQ